VAGLKQTPPHCLSGGPLRSVSGSNSFCHPPFFFFADFVYIDFFFPNYRRRTGRDPLTRPLCSFLSFRPVLKNTATARVVSQRQPPLCAFLIWRPLFVVVFSPALFSFLYFTRTFLAPLSVPCRIFKPPPSSRAGGTYRMHCIYWDSGAPVLVGCFFLRLL